MDAGLSPSDVQKEFGLASDMTLSVRTCFNLVIGTNICLKTAMRRVLHLKLVTQCAMLEDFGIFLVLADKVCQTRLVYDDY